MNYVAQACAKENWLKVWVWFNFHISVRCEQKGIWSLESFSKENLHMAGESEENSLLSLFRTFEITLGSVEESGKK